jgi:hypothetical protein
MKSLKVYVASSWRNPHYERVIGMIRDLGHQVWDWRNPPTGGNGFSWQEVGREGYRHGDRVTLGEWRAMLTHPIAGAGFASDLAGMNWCDVGVLLHPAGRSAHLEAGWLAGRGKKVHVLVLEPTEPDLMILALNGSICGSEAELLEILS